MYCKNCGKEIDDKADICIHCGVKVDKKQVQYYEEDGDSKAGLGVVMSLFLGLIGLIIGLCMYSSGSYERKTFMKGWGITTLVCVIVGVILYFTVFAGLLAGLGSYYY